MPINERVPINERIKVSRLMIIFGLSSLALYFGITIFLARNNVQVFVFLFLMTLMVLFRVIYFHVGMDRMQFAATSTESTTTSTSPSTIESQPQNTGPPSYEELSASGILALYPSVLPPCPERTEDEQHPPPYESPYGESNHYRSYLHDDKYFEEEPPSYEEIMRALDASEVQIHEVVVSGSEGIGPYPTDREETLEDTEEVNS